MWRAAFIADVTRAMQSESRHAGHIVLCGPDGGLLGACGDVDCQVFPRSAIKLIQCLPLVETGAADRFSFSDPELALCCSSHSGLEQHTQAVAGILARIGLTEADLACGVHEPLDADELRRLWRSDGGISQLHNNCSGKHAAMLATAVHLGDQTRGYQRPDHPVQRRIRSVLGELTGEDLTHVIAGVDGCSVPNWPIPLRSLAWAFARLGSRRELSAARRAAAERILAACWAAPEAMEGPGRLSTQILAAFPGEVFVKSGAEGVFCGFIRRRGDDDVLGFALKVEDGAKRAAEIATLAILARFQPGAEKMAVPHVIYNAAGLAVGDVRPSEVLVSLLERVDF